ncbi:C40 family peptidase [Anaerosporobacter faecicola]|uniref:C40 family peptidase n=1 Tax=Anaerosporobacter faecicola TaxID=2718714 RepID=UPI00143A142A|nr:C40 family peptidase [Anaerosporobacter faecicola]
MKMIIKKIWIISAAGIILSNTATYANIAKAEENKTKSVTDYSIEDMEKIVEQEIRVQDISLTFNNATLVEEALMLEEEADQELAVREAKVRELEKKEEIVLANVNYYLNVRSKPDENSKILGKLYKNGVGTILKEKNGWYKITSGSVTGYVKGDYVLTGEKARKKADEVGKRLAIVTTTTLKLREKAKADAVILTLVGEGEVLSVKKESEKWIKVKTDDHTGYVSADYVNVYTENEEAESIEEEQARLQREEEERRAEQERQEALANQQAAQNQTTGRRPSSNGATSSGTASSGSTSTNSSNTTSNSSGTTATGNKSLGQKIANYATQFRGNPYVYGGTSLTNGADCSGFVLSVYRKFGISLPRTSGAQASAGRRVASISQAQPGDLIAYSGHIGIYIGNGKLVHASSPRTGIIISNVNYRPIKAIRRIV